VARKCETICHPVGPQDILNMDEMAFFNNAQPKRALALKGPKCRGGVLKIHNESHYITVQMVVKNFIH
jgi:hypothetical protein